MLYCTKCGKELKEGSKFCNGCGAKLELRSRELTPVKVKTTVKGSSKASKGKLILICAIILIIVLVILGRKMGLSIVPSKNVDLKDCVTIITSGYSTIGEATYEIDKEKAKKILIRANHDLKGSDTLNTMVDNLRVSFSQEDHLTNGDKIEVSLTTKYKELYANHNLKFKDQTWDYKINDLDKVLEIDPFSDEYMELSFDDAAPFLTIDANQKVRNLNGINIRYKITQDTDTSYLMALGDPYTISVMNSDLEEITRQHGIVLTRTEIQKTVEKGEVPYRIDSINDLTEEQLKQMKAHAMSEITNYLSDETKWSYSSDIEYEGAVVAHITNPKNGETEKFTKFLNRFMAPFNYIDNYNSTILVFSADVIEAEGNGKKQKIYFPEEFAYVTSYPDGDFDYSTVGMSLDFNKYEGGVYSDLKSIKKRIQDTFYDGYYTVELTGKLK